jgi:hypothetical protein
MPIKLISSGGGSVILDAPSTGSNFTVNVPALNGNLVTTADTGTITQGMLGAGLAGNGPAFSVYRNAAQSVPHNTFTRINFDVEEFDTANRYDNTTNYRFTPNVAGYYQITVAVSLNLPGASASTMIAAIYKNGSIVTQHYITSSGISNTYSGNVSKLIYMNGTTDFIEGYVYQNQGVDRSIQTGPSWSYMTGFLARAA